MHLDDWQSIRRLVLCCHLDEVVSLEGAIARLLKTLPHTQIEVWTPLPSPSSGSLTQSNAVLPWITIPSWIDGTTIDQLRQASFDAAILLTAPGRSPYAMAYACYLAGIPIRVGQSQEFGGRVLSHCITPPLDPVSTVDYHLHLLQACGFPAVDESIHVHHPASTPSVPAPVEPVRL